MKDLKKAGNRKVLFEVDWNEDIHVLLSFLTLPYSVQGVIHLEPDDTKWNT